MRTAHIYAALWKMLGDLAANVGHPLPPGRDDPRINVAEEFIKAHLATNIGVEQIAEVASLSRSQLTRLYQKRLGFPPAARLRDLRIQHAKHMLETTTLSVKEIARACGFPSTRTFTQTFRKISGRTPREQRAAKLLLGRLRQ